MKPTWYLAPYSDNWCNGGRQAPHSILAYRNGKGTSHHRIAEFPVDHKSARKTSDNIRDVLKERHGTGGGYLVVGGDHSITTGIMEARESCHLVLFDAHSDDYSRSFSESSLDHGNWVSEVASQDLLTGITWFNYRNIEFSMQKCKDLVRDIPMDGRIHVSVDIDVLDPHYYNWASAYPVNGGCSLDQLLKDIESIKGFDQDITLDFVEYDPTRDVSHGGAFASSLIIDALLGLIDA